MLGAIAATAAQVILNGRLIDQVAGRNAERDFLEALVDGEEPEAVLVARARRLGIELAEQHVAVVFEADPAAGDPDEALARVRTAVLGAFPGSACAVRGLQAIALLRVRDESQLAARLERAAKRPAWPSRSASPAPAPAARATRRASTRRRRRCAWAAPCAGGPP